MLTFCEVGDNPFYGGGGGYLSQNSPFGSGGSPGGSARVCLTVCDLVPTDDASVAIHLKISETSYSQTACRSHTGPFGRGMDDW